MSRKESFTASKENYALVHKIFDSLKFQVSFLLNLNWSYLAGFRVIYSPPPPPQRLEQKKICFRISSYPKTTRK